MSSNSHYRSIFDQFDLNGDGQISRNELLVALRSAGVKVSEERLHIVLKGADADASGGIDFQEFATFLEAFANPSDAAAAKDLPRLRQIFQAAADVNGFDLVGADELRSLTADSGVVKVTPAEAVVMETVAAALRERSVDFDEFLTVWRAAEGK